VIFLHLPIGETCSRQGELVHNHYKTFPFIIFALESPVREATASVRRTQLAVVRHKCTNRHVTRKRDSDQTRPADT
jgi:hypothetical protein